MAFPSHGGDFRAVPAEIPHTPRRALPVSCLRSSGEQSPWRGVAEGGLGQHGEPGAGTLLGAAVGGTDPLCRHGGCPHPSSGAMEGNTGRRVAPLPVPRDPTWDLGWGTSRAKSCGFGCRNGAGARKAGLRMALTGTGKRRRGSSLGQKAIFGARAPPLGPALYLVSMCYFQYLLTN